MKTAEIFLRFLKVGAIGFGGGSALIPVIEKEIVGAGKPMQPEEYAKHTVIANITPGAQPVKLGASCGYQLGGVGGALAGAYGSALPGVALTLLGMALFSVMGQQAIGLFRNASVGISVFIVMLLLDYTLKTCRTAASWALCAASFAVTCGKELRALLVQLVGRPLAAPLATPIFDIQTIDLMLVSFALIAFSITKPSRWQAAAAGVFALAFCFFKGSMGANALAANAILLLGVLAIGAKLLAGKKPKARARSLAISRKALAAMAAFLAIPLAAGLLAGFFAAGLPALLGGVGVSTLTSFGGGAAYISVADGFFVQTGQVPTDTFYTQLLPIVNALPGPVLVKVVAGVGFLLGQQTSPLAAWLAAAAATALAVGLCGVVSLLVLQLYEAVEGSAFIQSLKRTILPVICGMLLSTCCAMLFEAGKITAEKAIPAPLSLLSMLLAVAVLRLLSKKFRIPDLALLLAAALLGFVLLL